MAVATLLALTAGWLAVAQSHIAASATQAPAEWQPFIFTGATLVAVNGLFFWAVKWALDRAIGILKSQIKQSEKFYIERVKEHEEANKESRERVTLLEQDLLKLKGELAQYWVHREDWIRGVSTLDAKMDSLREGLDELRRLLYERTGCARKGEDGAGPLAGAGDPERR